MENRTKIAIIGCSKRGMSLLTHLAQMKDVEIVGVCDLYEDRAVAAAEKVKELGGYEPIVTTEYKRLLEIKEIEAVVTPSSWRSHVQICLDSMEAGKYVATEVGGASTLDQCYELVKVSQRTGMPCMMLENCCYGRTEMTVLNMIKKGLFGEPVYAAGGYCHDLREEIAYGKENRHYRLRNFLNRNAELYPTHQLGPIAKWLDINRGNRMLSLVSMSSKAAGMEHYISTKLPADHELQGKSFNQGDIVITLIKCARGETILLNHGTTLPRPYTRMNQLQGTKGIYCEDKNQGVYIDGLSAAEKWQTLEDYYPEYEHPLWKQYRTEGVRGGHGGMDYLVLRGFVEAVQQKTNTPIDVYDTAAWMAIGPLSEESISMGGHPVAIPDFTNGMWLEREPITRGMFCLDDVCEEFYHFPEEEKAPEEKTPAESAAAEVKKEEPVETASAETVPGGASADEIPMPKE